MSEYQSRAVNFLKKTGVQFSCSYLEHDFYFEDDKQCRDIYQIRLQRGKKSFSFKFGQSIANNGIEPTPYDVLACLTKYEVGTFENFCSEFGYDEDSRKAFKTYKAVLKEYAGVQRIWDDNEIEELQEIN